VESVFLDIFKTHLDKAPGNLAWSHSGLSRRLDGINSLDSPEPNDSMSSKTSCVTGSARNNTTLNHFLY